MSSNHGHDRVERRPPGRVHHSTPARRTPAQLHRVIAKLLPDGQLQPYSASRMATEPLGEYFTGHMTAIQFKHLKGVVDTKPFLGFLMSGQDGTFVYQARHLIADLERVANHWNDHNGTSLSTIDQLPDDATEISVIMDHMVAWLVGIIAATTLAFLQ